MSWVCDTCSCNNEDDALECSICGETRSMASIREGKRREREKRLEEISSFVYDKLFFGIKLATMILGVLVLLAFIIKIASGSLFFDLKVNFDMLFGLILQNIRLFFTRLNSVNFFGIILDRLRNSGAFFKYAGVPSFFSNVLGCMFSSAFLAFGLTFDNFISVLPSVNKLSSAAAMCGRIKTGFLNLGTVLKNYFYHSELQLGGAALYLAAVFEKLKASWREISAVVLIASEHVKCAVMGAASYARRICAKFIK